MSDLEKKVAELTKQVEALTKALADLAARLPLYPTPVYYYPPYYPTTAPRPSGPGYWPQPWEITSGVKTCVPNDGPTTGALGGPYWTT